MTRQIQIVSDSIIQSTSSICDIRCPKDSTPQSKCECSCSGHNHGQTMTLIKLTRDDDSDTEFADRRKYTGECLLCSEDFGGDETPWTIQRSDPLWSEIPNPPEDAEMVDVCDDCYTKWLMEN
jgi:hypothetical protein